MKRIITILSLITMMFISGITYADDINIFLNNRADSATNSDAKPQILFLIDIVANGEEVCGDWACYDLNENELAEGCPDAGDGGGDSGKCYTASNAPSGGWQFSDQLASPPDFEYLADFIFEGEVCAFYSGNGQTYIKKRNCAIDGVDSRAIIKEVMQQRPDAKIGVMALNDSKSAKLILPVAARDTGSLEADIAKLMENPAEIMLDGSSIPTAGGLAAVNDYLKGVDTPLTEECENAQLVILTNGGWKEDAHPNTTSLNDITGITAPSETNATFLTNVAAYLKTEPGNGCKANILTSVIGLGVATNDSDIPLFRSSLSNSPAQNMAAAGGGIFLNTGDGSTIVNAVLEMLDYSYPTPSALITPTAPVSISRSHNIDLLFASAFKPEGKVVWPGNMTMGTVAEWTDGGSIDPQAFNIDQEFTNSALITPSNGITIKTDLGCSSSVLCEWSDSSDSVLTQDDINWLKGTSLSDMSTLLGDPLHFKPLAIHYGDLDDGNDLSDSELYLLVGTNRGLLHMFQYTGSGLAHQWAFLPKELEAMIPALRNGNLAPAYNMVNHFYGVDGAPSAFIYDANRDGKIETGGFDRVLTYFGLRRGGATYYALDLTNPTSPKLQWSRGKSVADYGTKPGANMDEFNTSRPEIKKIPAGGGPCPVFSTNAADGTISTLNNSTNDSGGYCVNCLNVTPEVEAHKEYLGKFDGSTKVYNHVAVYLKDVIDNQPIFTQVNQCVRDLSGVNSYTFDAHPVALDPMSRQISSASCTGRSTNVKSDPFEGASGIGVQSSYRTIQTIVGFDLTSLPENAYITSARVSMGHVGKGTEADAATQYNSGVAIWASKDGYYGEEPGNENSGGTDCTDWDEANSSSDSYTYVGAIKSPSGGSVALGARTTDGQIFPEFLFPHFYDNGVINDNGKYALTKLLRKGINDDNHQISWQQFVIQSAQDLPEIVVWGAPKSGKIPSDYAYENYTGSDSGIGSYWDAVVPKLEITWTLTPPSASEPSDLEDLMSIDNSEFITCLDGSCSSTSDDYSIKIIVTGSGTVSGDGTNSCSVSNSPCIFTYTTDTEVNLITSGGTFQNWDGACTGSGSCSVIPVESGTVPEVTATFEAAACTPGNGTASLTVSSLETEKGLISINGGASISSYEGLQLCPGSIMVKAMPEEGYKFDKWNSGLASCSTATCTVTITDASIVGSVTFVADGGGTDTFNLTVGETETGTGAGTFVVAPSGDDCSPVVAGCSSHAKDTNVTVTVTANDNAVFKEWGDACSGTGTCTVKMEGHRSVTAKFNNCFTAWNYHHEIDGRAYKAEKSSFLWHAYAKGSGYDLGQLGSSFYSATTSVEETSSDYWENVGNCN